MKLRLLIRVPSVEPYPFDFGGLLLVVGRDPSCEVNFRGLPVQGVSWRHARIQTTATGPVIQDLGSTNGTYVNGERIAGQTNLKPGDEIRCGRNGPSIKVTACDGAMTASLSPQATFRDKLPSPDSPALNESIFGSTRIMLMRMQDNFGTLQRRYRVMVLVTVLGSLTGLAVLGTVLWLHSRGGETGAAAAVQKAPEETRKREEEPRKTEPEVLGDTGWIYKKYGDAVYFVLVPTKKGNIMGTAFAVDATGHFGTNAHVARPVRESLEQGFKPVLISQGGTRQYPIVAAEWHKAWKDDNSYSADVAVLTARLPPDETVPVVVQLATEAELRELAPGTPLLYIGFPVFEVDGSDYLGSDAKIIARVFSGNLNRLLTFKKELGEFKDQYCLEHDMKTWNGASGSPIFNLRGKVVGLHNAGYQVQGVKMAGNPNKGGIRVDLLRELLGGNAP